MRWSDLPCPYSVFSLVPSSLLFSHSCGSGASHDIRERAVTRAVTRDRAHSDDERERERAVTTRERERVVMREREIERTVTTRERERSDDKRGVCVCVCVCVRVCVCVHVW